MPEDVGKMYDELGVGYLQKIENDSPKEFDEFLALVAPGENVLDVGCAGGRDARRFADRGAKVFGVDLSPVFVEEARKLVPEGTFEVADALDLPFPDGHFTKIWANAVFVHLPKAQLPDALRSLARVLAAGGVLELRVKKENPNATPEEVAQAKEGRADSFTYFTDDEVQDAISAAGLTLHEFKELPSRRPGLLWTKVRLTK